MIVFASTPELYVAYKNGRAVGYARLRNGKVCAIEGVTSALWSRLARVSGQDPTDMLEASLPFIYDIDGDQIVVGQPGQQSSQIPGAFSPGGIVEGTYEPGGKVTLQTSTSMPMTIRHLVDLWYHSYPNLEVKSVWLTTDAGKPVKLATR